MIFTLILKRSKTEYYALRNVVILGRRRLLGMGLKGAKANMVPGLSHVEGRVCLGGYRSNMDNEKI